MKDEVNENIRYFIQGEGEVTWERMSEHLDRRHQLFVEKWKREQEEEERITARVLPGAEGAVADPAVHDAELVLRGRN